MVPIRFSVMLTAVVLPLIMLVNVAALAGRIAYIHGNVAPDGTTPAPNGVTPYDQMLLTDTGNTGLSAFRAMVIGQGHSISQYYDQTTILNAGFLNGLDTVIFGLHQKIWSTAEKSALDIWLRGGGGILIYSDSASGGFYSSVGAQNPIGQQVVRNLMLQYGIQVTVDQANGVKAYRAGPGASGLMSGRPVLEGEGVSPVAFLPGSRVTALIPYRDNSDNRVSGNPAINHTQGLQNASSLEFAALAYRSVGSGRIIAMFDRQPMWNDGPGSDIDKRMNREILRRVMNFLAQRPAGPDPAPTPGPAPPATGSAGSAVVAPMTLLLN